MTIGTTKAKEMTEASASVALLLATALFMHGVLVDIEYELHRRKTRQIQMEIHPPASKLFFFLPRN